MRTVDDAIRSINAIYSVEEEEQLEQLDQALQVLFQSEDAERGMEALFQLFERFPQSDGYGLFWSILHELEKFRSYRERLIRSVQIQPMEFNLIMVNRLLNIGVTRVNEVHLVELLYQVATSRNYSKAAQQKALQFLNGYNAREYIKD